MGAMFTAFFAFVVQLFSAAEKSASALNHLATWADEAAGTFEDRARWERQQKVNAMLAEAGISELPKANTKPALSKAVNPAAKTVAP